VPNPDLLLCEGDLFHDDAQTLTIAVNCVGVMGKGIALTAKQRDQELFREYRKLCEAGRIQPGKPAPVRRLSPPSYLLFPTKKHWRANSRIEDIELGLDELVRSYRDWGIESLAIPPLGCGHGGLSFTEIGPLMVAALDRLEVPVALYVPAGVPADAETLETLRVAARDLELDPDIRRILSCVAGVRTPVDAAVLDFVAYFAEVLRFVAPLGFEATGGRLESASWSAHVRHLLKTGWLEGDGSYRLMRSVAGPGDAAGRQLARAANSIEPDSARLAVLVHAVVAEGGTERLDGTIHEQLDRSVDAKRIHACSRWLRSRGWLRTDRSVAAV